MKSSAKEFELFTQRVYQKLVDNDVIKPTKVEHNVKLHGKSGCEHQIDVYWEYEIAGNKHRVAIECKNYNKRVEKEKVCAFQGVLADLDNVEGIMVTKIGFQKGAKIYAKQYGISLKELRAPGPDDVAGEITTIFHINRTRCLYLIDEEYAKQTNLNLQRLRDYLAFTDPKNADKWKTATHIPLTLKDRAILNSTGEKISSVDELKAKLSEKPTTNSSQVFKFEDVWIDTAEYGQVKIREVKYEFASENQETTIQLAADMFVEAILKDAISGESQYVPK
jgi:hypothetical protein